MGFSAATYAALLSRVKQMINEYLVANAIPASSYFTSLEDAKEAAATAGEYGSSTTPYFFGSKILVYENKVATWYTIQNPGVLVPDTPCECEESGDGTVFVMVDGVDYSVGNGDSDVIDDIVSVLINESDNDTYINISEAEATAEDMG